MATASPEPVLESADHEGERGESPGSSPDVIGADGCPDCSLMGRRRFMKALAVGTGAAAVGVGSSSLPEPYSPVGRAEALIPVGLVGAALTGAAVGYLSRLVQDHLTGEDFDETAYDTATQDEKHAAVIENAKEMQYYDDQVFTQMNNLLIHSKQIAYGDARYKAIEQMNLGATEADTLAAAETVVDEFFVTQQKNLMTHHSVQMGKLNKHFATASHLNQNVGNNTSGFYMKNEDGTNPDTNPDYDDYYQQSITRNITLIDASSFTTECVEIDHTDGSQSDLVVYCLSINDVGNGWDYGDEITWIEPVSTGEAQAILRLNDYLKIWNDIATYHSETISEIGNFVSNVYPSYAAGEIDLADVLLPSELASMADVNNTDPLSGADLAVMGLKADTESRTTIYLESDQVFADGSIYMKPDETESSLEVGTTYSPSQFAGPVWLAYQDLEPDEGSSFDPTAVDEVGVIEVTQDFTILEAEAADGTSLSTVTYTDEASQSTTTTDITELKEELDRLAQLRDELEQQKLDLIEEATSGGGGGGLFPNGIVSWAKNNPAQAVVGGGGGALGLKYLFKP